MNGIKAHAFHSKSYLSAAPSTVAVLQRPLPSWHVYLVHQMGRVNKGGQFSPTDSNEKSMTVDRQEGHMGKKAKVKCTTVLVFAVQSWSQDQVIIMSGSLSSNSGREVTCSGKKPLNRKRGSTVRVQIFAANGFESWFFLCRAG